MATVAPLSSAPTGPPRPILLDGPLIRAGKRPLVSRRGRRCTIYAWPSALPVVAAVMERWILSRMAGHAQVARKLFRGLGALATRK